MNADPAALPSRPSPGAAGARLGELYAEHARMVLGICRLLLRDSSEAEDATQQVFLSAYRSLLAGTVVEKPGAWLGTIARNESRTRLAARSREPGSGAEVEAIATPALEEQAEGRQRAAELYAALAALPEKQREAVVLRDVYGLRYAEVALALGTSKPAVEALLFRGRRRLQHHLRPRLVAGVLVVPLAIQESLAYAVPGFASTAAPAAGAAVAVPLLAKLAAGGAAVALAGSAGVAVERGVHDPPRQPPPAPRAVHPDPPAAAALAGRIVSPPPPAARAASVQAGEGESAEERGPRGEDLPERVESEADDGPGGEARSPETRAAEPKETVEREAEPEPELEEVEPTEPEELEEPEEPDEQSDSARPAEAGESAG